MQLSIIDNHLITLRKVLASGSADNTVKIWDVTTQTCSHTFTHHTDKVQDVTWHPTEAWLLATGSFDKTVAIIDCRAPGKPVVTFGPLPSDVEALSWDPHCSQHLYCAMEDGQISCFDLRKAMNGDMGGANSAVCTFQAHGSTTSSMSFSPRCPGLLVSASIDKTVKVWDCQAMHNYAASSEVAGGYECMSV